jgi:hypothetical protein
MKKLTLTKGIVRLIEDAVDKLYDRAKARFLGKPPIDKRISFSFTPRVNLVSLFTAANTEERNRPDLDLLNSLLKIADGFIESQRINTKTQVVKAVDAWMNEAHAKGVKTDVETVLGGELAKVWSKASNGLHKIFDAEASNVRNVGTLDSIIKVNAGSGIEDPVVYFVVVRDDDLCDECRRLHLMPDGVTPRLWHLSDVGHGYHKKGDEDPKIGGLHPHCRCSLVTLLPGYGFVDGKVEFIKLDHDEMKKQR